jgi:Xaa-Pro aminopeptidase
MEPAMRPNRSILLPAVLLLGLAAPETRADDAPKRLIEQPLSEYKARRQALMKRIKEADAPGMFFRGGDGAAEGARRSSGPVVVLMGETEEHDDGRYRQRNDFLYLTGVETPHAALILWPAEGKEVLYLPPRDKREEAWTGPKIGPGPEGVAATGFDRVEPRTAFLGDLFHAIGDAGKRSFASRPAPVFLLTPDPRPNDGGPSAMLARLIKEGAPQARPRDLAPFLAELRKAKSESEIPLLRKAIAITADAQAGAIRTIGPGVPEYKVEGVILGAFLSGGGSRAGFPSIVGSGLNSTVLHYNANRRTMGSGETVVVDIGGEYAYYTADITRTYPVSGKFTPRQREIYQLVLDCQSACAAEFKVGKSTLQSQNMFAKSYMARSPLRARDEQGVEHTMDHFFIHGLGHYLGMDVHDVGDTLKACQPGEVFTIEPGIYIPSEGFGVRIEDDYLVTKDGLEKLSRDIPVEVADIERLMAEAREKRPAAARREPAGATP